MDLSVGVDNQLYLNDAELYTVVWPYHENEDSYILMNRDKEPGKGAWTAPGGKIEQQDLKASAEFSEESLEEAAYRCARRELEEETSLHDRNLEIIGKALQVGRPEGFSDGTPQAMYHLVATVDGKPEKKNRREGKLDTYTTQEVRELDMGMVHDRFVKNILEDQEFTAVIDDSGSWVSGYSSDHFYINETGEIMEWPETLLESNLMGEPKELSPEYWPDAEKNVKEIIKEVSDRS